MTEDKSNTCPFCYTVIAISDPHKLVRPDGQAAHDYCVLKKRLDETAVWACQAFLRTCNAESIGQKVFRWGWADQNKVRRCARLIGQALNELALKLDREEQADQGDRKSRIARNAVRRSLRQQAERTSHELFCPIVVGLKIKNGKINGKKRASTTPASTGNRSL